MGRNASLSVTVGALYGSFLGAFSPKDFYFDLTFTLVSMLIVGGMLTVTGAVAGAPSLARAQRRLLETIETLPEVDAITV